MARHGMENLKIDNEFKNLLPPLTEDEYSQLESDIKRHGVLSPIIAWNGFIIDGHNRYEICRKNGIDLPEIKALDFSNKSDVMDWIINHQTGRRNLTKSQLVKAYASVEEQLKREAKERQVVAGKEFGKGGSKVTSNLTEAIGKTPETAEVVAKKIGVSKNTYKGMKQIVSEGTPEQVARMDKGGKGNGVSAIVAEIKEEKASKNVREGYKICPVCKTEKPLSEFGANRYICRQCDAERTFFRRGRGVFGNKAVISDKFKNLSESEMEGKLYERKDVEFEDSMSGLRADLESWKRSIDRATTTNAKYLVDDGNKALFKDAIKAFISEIEKTLERI